MSAKELKLLELFNAIEKIRRDQETPNLPVPLFVGSQIGIIFQLMHDYKKLAGIE